jgi:N-acetyl-gamma-glutamyl-phosphate reductase
MVQKIKTIILGASGYTGAELIRFLMQHPHVEIIGLSAERHAGQKLAEVFPHLGIYNLPDLVHIDELNFMKCDLVFCALPHGTTQKVIAGLPKHVKVVDLSADFRLRDPAAYEHWYGHPHQALELQRGAVYGLPEIARDKIRDARLVANPGCYPTASSLPLLPLLKYKLIETDGIIIDAKSGVSGAGRAAKQNLLYTEVAGGMSAYGVGNHRHTPEIEQILGDAAGKKIHINFTPHLIPMNRGMLATIYVKLATGKTVADLRMALGAAYDAEPFVHILPDGKYPHTKFVSGTNHCAISLSAGHVPDTAILISAIDNLGKGASGQAVQNMNIMFGWEETLGASSAAVFP